MSPSRSTAISMFSGLVIRGRLRSFGSCTGTVWVTTGIVMRKMIKRTNMTSTRGVVLMLETTSSSSPDAPTFIAMVASRSCSVGTAAEQQRVHFDGEGANALHRGLVAADQ